LGAKLLAEIGQLAHAPVAVLAGPALALVDGALRAAPDVLSEAAVDLVLGANALGHFKALQYRAVAELERPLLCPAEAGPTGSGRMGPMPRVRKSNAGPIGPHAHGNIRIAGSSQPAAGACRL